ncbi:class I SAM-dependent methyltransferase [Streptomyces sp. NPDC059456]|uniref:class I SAM-dependent methyltransferase n=1 Tax=Streptomyces sp. NPDC059456 TaxID=3346838 RepID=UPI003697AABA
MPNSHMLPAPPLDRSRGNGAFYRARGASSIMRAAHFPDEVLAFFQMENLAAMETIATYGCSDLVELGCYDGRSLEIARAAGIDYLGIDLNTAAVDLLHQRIADERLQGRARARVGDATRSQDWMGEVTGPRPLVLLPFNLLGNFPDPTVLLRSVEQVGGIALLSVFAETPRATSVRRDYYRACGISPLAEAPGPYGGIEFRSGDHFRSQSFSRDALVELSTSCGISVLGETTNRVGHCLTVCLGQKETQPREH